MVSELLCSERCYAVSVSFVVDVVVVVFFFTEEIGRVQFECHSPSWRVLQNFSFHP